MTPQHQRAGPGLGKGWGRRSDTPRGPLSGSYPVFWPQRAAVLFSLKKEPKGEKMSQQVAARAQILKTAFPGCLATTDLRRVQALCQRAYSQPRVCCTRNLLEPFGF
ncbi:unnamed protein product [Rangifer tarandus platyrhynchus]|uniref:Uncharacterized protein n=1 Tax=Rangifer tarandus platyrhynchus TaxID=3082113 RepID=A0AC60A382_RANTA